MNTYLPEEHYELIDLNQITSESSEEYEIGVDNYILQEKELQVLYKHRKDTENHSKIYYGEFSGFKAPETAFVRVLDQDEIEDLEDLTETLEGSHHVKGALDYAIKDFCR